MESWHLQAGITFDYNVAMFYVGSYWTKYILYRTNIIIMEIVTVNFFPFILITLIERVPAEPGVLVLTPHFYVLWSSPVELWL